MKKNIFKIMELFIDDANIFSGVKNFRINRTGIIEQITKIKCLAANKW